MIKLFRKIRQKLLSENKFSKYLIYAVGEIILVVIGILIALGINSWNENRKQEIIENKYINDLIQDLENDLVNLTEIISFMQTKNNSKNLVESLLDENSELPDSTTFHFYKQWEIIGMFTPSNVTFEDLKNSGNLTIIRNLDLRRSIVSHYNDYLNERLTEELFIEQNVKLLGIVNKIFDNALKPQVYELNIAVTNKEFKNGIRTNLTGTRLRELVKLRKKCQDLLKKLNNYNELINDK